MNHASYVGIKKHDIFVCLKAGPIFIHAMIIAMVSRIQSMDLVEYGMLWYKWLNF